MGFFRDLQRSSYKVSRLSGDLAAAQRGTLAKRVVRRRVTRSLAKPYGRLWR